MKKSVLISAGSIPAKLDSVKYIGNRFGGGLAARVAYNLHKYHNLGVTLLKWKYTRGLEVTGVSVVEVDDVMEYLHYVKRGPAHDAYIMSGAVANLMPANPWKGKFPSHRYNAGDEFKIEFKITPRVIDAVKARLPRSTLIGYKLFDGSNDELIDAAKTVLYGSKSNVVFANTPKDAKNFKFAVMPDGAAIPMNFDEHCDFIARIIQAKWFSTLLRGNKTVILAADEAHICSKYPRSGKFGTFAIRRPGGGFITTTRGKTGQGYCKVFGVDFEQRMVFANRKATMNAPLLANIFRKHPDINYVFHNHKTLKDLTTVPYRIPGTTEDNDCMWHSFNIENHGYIKSFTEFEEANEFMSNELEYVF